MAVKLVVIYPRPKDIDAFEYVCKNERVPMAVEALSETGTGLISQRSSK